MATIKSYTDISQSRTLSNILPLESADMYYDDIIDSVTGELFIPDDGSTIKVGKGLSGSVAAWSLAALLSVIQYPTLFQNGDEEWGCTAWIDTTRPYSISPKDNPVDACYEMILKLHELNLL